MFPELQNANRGKSLLHILIGLIPMRRFVVEDFTERSKVVLSEIAALPAIAPCESWAGR